MRRKWLAIIGVSLSLLICVSAANAGSSIKLVVNGKEIKTDVPVQTIKNRTLAPIRALAEALGAEVNWNGKKGIVEITTTDKNNNQSQSNNAQNNNDAERISRLEEALAPATPYEAVQMWAKGVKTRNGALQFALYSSELKKQYYDEFSSNNWSTGTSSPWVSGFTIKELQKESNGGYSFEVDFMLATSTGSAGSDEKIVNTGKQGENWVITGIETPDTVSDGASENNSNNDNSNSGGNKGITVNKLDYIIMEYDQLPANVKAEVNKLNKEEKTTKVIPGEGDSQYVYIGLGVRATGGYDIEIKSVEDVEGRIAVVYKEIKPDPGLMLIQVITYPCKIIKVNLPLPVTVTEDR
jgi:hypothetical protein